MAKLETEKKAVSAAASALDNYPKEKIDFQREFVDHLKILEEDKKAASNEYAAHVKGLTEKYNREPAVGKMIKAVAGLTADRRARALVQFIFELKKMNLDEQLDLFNSIGEPGGLVNTDGKDEKTVFDAAGNKAAPKASERETVKKLTGAEPPAHVPTPGIPLDEAQKRFEEANAKGKATRGETATPVPPSAKAGAAVYGSSGQQDDKAAEKVSPAKKASATPVPPSPASRSAAATAKVSTRRMNRAPTPSEAKKIADGYFKDPAAKDADKNDDENDNFTGVIH